MTSPALKRRTTPAAFDLLIGNRFRPQFSMHSLVLRTASWAIEIRNIRHPSNPFSPAKQSKFMLQVRSPFRRPLSFASRFSDDCVAVLTVDPRCIVRTKPLQGRRSRRGANVS